jgi:lipopolysaccharide transport system ATP-binding protein
MAAVNALCSRTLWIDQGSIRGDGATDEVVPRYLVADAEASGERIWAGGVADPGITEFKLVAVRILNSRDEVAGVLDVRKPFVIEIEYEVLVPMAAAWIGLRLDTVEGVAVVVAHDADDEALRGVRQPGRYASRCAVPGHLLNAGRFIVSIAAGLTGVKQFAVQQNVLTFDIEDLGIAGPRVGGKRKGVILPQFEWRIVSRSASERATVS